MLLAVNMDGIAITRILEQDDKCYAGMEPAFAEVYPDIKNPEENFEIPEEDIVRMIELNEGHLLERYCSYEFWLEILVK